MAEPVRGPARNLGPQDLLQATKCVFADSGESQEVLARSRPQVLGRADARSAQGLGGPGGNSLAPPGGGRDRRLHRPSGSIRPAPRRAVNGTKVSPPGYGGPIVAFGTSYYAGSGEGEQGSTSNAVRCRARLERRPPTLPSFAAALLSPG